MKKKRETFLISFFYQRAFIIVIKVCVSGSDGKSLSVEEEAASIVQGTYKINKVAHYFFFFLKSKQIICILEG